METMSKEELFKGMVEDLKDTRIMGLSESSTLNDWRETGDFYEEHLTQELLAEFLALWNDPEGICHDCGASDIVVENHQCGECWAEDASEREIAHHNYMNGYGE